MGKKAKDSDNSGEAVPPTKRVTAKRAAAKEIPAAAAVPKTKRAPKPAGAATPARKPAARKVAGRDGATKSGATNGVGSGNGAGYTQDDVALRAYFISENRRAAGLPGDSQSDWLEAERQLREEAGRTKQRA